MPQWLQRQLQRAFHGKDREEIRMLNECWFAYYRRAVGDV